MIGLIDDWLIIDTEPIDSNVWLDRERWTNIDFVMIFVPCYTIYLLYTSSHFGSSETKSEDGENDELLKIVQE